MLLPYTTDLKIKYFMVIYNNMGPPNGESARFMSGRSLFVWFESRPGHAKTLKIGTCLQSGQALGMMTVAGKFSNADAIFIGVRSCCLLPSHRNNLVEDQVCAVEKWAISLTP